MYFNLTEVYHKFSEINESIQWRYEELKVGADVPDDKDLQTFDSSHWLSFVMKKLTRKTGFHDVLEHQF